MNRIRFIICLGFAGITPIAYAATSNVIFNGTVNSTCLLVLQSNGTMTASADLTTLSSKNTLGVAGLVQVTTTGGVNLGVDSTVSNVTRPASDTGTITWSPVYSTTGVHNLPESSSTRALNGPGADVVTVHLTGAKGAGETFAGGNYSATVTLRCEP